MGIECCDHENHNLFTTFPLSFISSSPSVSEVEESDVYDSPSPEAPCFSPIDSSSYSSQISSTSEEEDMTGHQLVHASQLASYKLVGDNIYKTVRPRHMRMDSQNRSLHYFHVYGVRDRIDVSRLDDQPSLPSLSDIDVTSLLPNTDDEKALMDLFSVHVARVLKKFMPFFAKFGNGLARHIQHQYSSEMSQKSEVVGENSFILIYF